MKKVLEIGLITPVSFVLAYLFNLFFLDLTEQSPLDQAALLFFLTCPLIYLIYIVWNERANLNFQINFDFSINKLSFQENLSGILLAVFFFSVYLYFGLWLAELKTGQVDNLFDADINSWTHRISSPNIEDFPMRGPHPFTYFIFRPFGLILNLFTKDPTISAVIFNASIGGLCVFLAWLFIKRQFQSKVYAFLVAALLGLSTSHLFFGLAVETYIFSAFALILFCLFLQENSKSITSLVFAGVLTFGITVTNFVQNMIGFIIARPSFSEITKFTSLVISISLVLTFLHAAIYPVSELFFLTTDVQNEEKFFIETSDIPDWRVQGRNIYLTRTILLYTSIAPKIFILTEEVGSVNPEFRLYKISLGTFHQANYSGLGQVLIGIWFLMITASIIVFLINLIRTKKPDVMLSFILCLIFNFIIHLFYGQELFLYSPDWAYALIFFVAFGLSSFSKNHFFQSGFLIFILLVGINQLQFLQNIFNTLIRIQGSLN